MLTERLKREIVMYAKISNLDKVILFGSRARGTNTDRSDIDLAVYGGDYDEFYQDI